MMIDPTTLASVRATVEYVSVIYFRTVNAIILRSLIDTARFVLISVYKASSAVRTYKPIGCPRLQVCEEMSSIKLKEDSLSTSLPNTLKILPIGYRNHRQESE